MRGLAALFIVNAAATVYEVVVEYPLDRPGPLVDGSRVYVFRPPATTLGSPSVGHGSDELPLWLDGYECLSSLDLAGWTEEGVVFFVERSPIAMRAWAELVSYRNGSVTAYVPEGSTSSEDVLKALTALRGPPPITEPSESMWWAPVGDWSGQGLGSPYIDGDAG